ncbi:MAG: relaxase MobL [Clostridiales bacterium]|nr:relaxase MobL [Clostridiales bacterium]
MFYIGTRPGAELNPGKPHGLFGNIGDGHGNLKIREASDYVKRKTETNTIMYRAIISLDEKDALRLGYDNRKTWENMLKENILTVTEGIGIAPSHIEYVAAVHMDKGHPHIHFMFWDKDQPVREAYVHSSVSNKIRVDITKNIYKEEMADLYALKNAVRGSLTGDMDMFYKSLVETVDSISEAEVMAISKTDIDKATGKLIYNRFSPSFIRETQEDIFRIRERLPKTGRLNYKLMPPEIKEDLDRVIHKIITNNTDFNREFKLYGQYHVDLAAFYSKNPEALEKAKKSAEDDISKRLANQLLKSIKEIDRRDSDSKEKDSGNREKDFKNTTTISIITGLFRTLSRQSQTQKNNVNNTRRELSRQAKIELMRKNEQASSIEWGEEQ